MENNTNKETNAETSKLLMLGFAYYTGIDSMPKDYHKAVVYFKRLPNWEILRHNTI